jgi:hypothetical protein
MKNKFTFTLLECNAWCMAKTVGNKNVVTSLFETMWKCLVDVAIQERGEGRRRKVV